MNILNSLFAELRKPARVLKSTQLPRSTFSDINVLTTNVIVRYRSLL